MAVISSISKYLCDCVAVYVHRKEMLSLHE